MNSESVKEHDCAVCLQKCHHPTQLPCGHIFCFLCVKGVAIQSKKCAMCRAQIPPDYLDHPVLLEKLSSQQTTEQNINGHFQWYYEGRNGWWKYDERSTIELETAFSAGEADCTLLLAGALYCIDFQSMLQVRRSDPTRRRRVRRDTPMLPAKGVAGIKDYSHRPNEERKTNNEQNSNEVLIESVDISTESDSDVIVIEDDDNDEDVPNESEASNTSVEIVNAFSSVTLGEPESLIEHTTENT